MAFLKYANARVVAPQVSMPAWDDVRDKATTLGSAFDKRASSKAVLQKYDPKQVMLTHCTIIASVDTEEAGVPLGQQMVEDMQIDRPYSDFYVTPQTTKFINNNLDAWERRLLLATYRTFVGGENYVEHLQVPELSKGKIIDACARDIGDSVYVDILVATDLKHRPLVKAIQTGQLSTLSMGCFLPGTPVTMADGTRLPIEEVQPGAMVLSHKGRPQEVLNQQIRGGRWQMRRVKVKGVPDAIEATGTHPFYVVRPASVCGCGCGEALLTNDTDPVRRMTKRFRLGHDKRLLNPNGSYSLAEFKSRQDQLAEIQSFKIEKVRADELQVGDYVVFPKLDTKAVGDPGTAKARLLGYFLAEGSFAKRRGVPTAVQFNYSLAETDTFVKETVDLLCEAFPGCTPWVQHREDRNTATVHVSGKKLAAWFKRHGGEYSHQKRLSPSVLRWSVDTQKHVLGAWLNGDGHKHNGGHTVGTTTSYSLLCQLHTLAIRCGIPVWVDCVFGGKTVTIAEAVANGQALRHDETGKLAAFNIYFPQASSSVLADVSAKAPQGRKSGSQQHLRTLGGNVIAPITEISSFVYEGFVHDIEVEEDHSYQVHGLGVSNCQVSFTICTKCGNAAEDETQLCKHVRFAKGNQFIDALGKTRKIAELCGHRSDPSSVKFIEASWVANPAFTGAVLRDILTPAENAAYSHRMQVAFASPARTADPGAYAKAARLDARAHDDKSLAPPYRFQALPLPYKFRTPAVGPRLAPDGIEARKLGFDVGLDVEGGPPDVGAPPVKHKTPLDEAIDALAESLREKAIEQVRREMAGGEVPRSDLAENRNDTLIRQAIAQDPSWRGVARYVLAQTKNPVLARKVLYGLVLHKSGGWQMVKAAGQQFSGIDRLAISRLLDLFHQMPRTAGESRIYRTVCAVGGVAAYANEDGYLAACRKYLGRQLTGTEIDALLTKGRIFDLAS